MKINEFLTTEQEEWFDDMSDILEYYYDNPHKTLIPNQNVHMPTQDCEQKGTTNSKCPRLDVGKIYYAFDDGKISMSRLLNWKIVKEIDLNQHDLDDMTRELLQYETQNYSWIFDDDQRFIYYADAVDKEGNYNDAIGHCYFLKSKGGYFGTGYWGSRLDIDGSLYREAMGYYEEVQKEELDNLSKTK